MLMKVWSSSIFNFRKNFVLFIIVIVTILSDVFFTTLNENHYMKNMELKMSLLESDSSKMIFIGGSSMAFGLLSEEVKYIYKDYEIVNFGLHAGIGLNYYLSLIDESLSKGDILIIGLEYEYFFRENDNLLLEKFTDNLINNGESYSLFSRLLFRLNNFTDSVVFFVFNNSYESIYRNKITNEYGDIVIHHNYYSQPELDVSKSRIGNEINMKFIDDLENIINSYESENIRVLLTFPPISKEYYLNNRESIYLIYNNLSLINKINIISNPYHFVFENEFFFDTHYHLSFEGSKIRTMRLIEDLSNFINVTNS